MRFLHSQNSWGRNNARLTLPKAFLLLASSAISLLLAQTQSVWAKQMEQNKPTQELQPTAPLDSDTWLRDIPNQPSAQGDSQISPFVGLLIGRFNPPSQSRDRKPLYSICTATIIASDAIITAQHCSNDPDLPGWELTSLFFIPGYSKPLLFPDNSRSSFIERILGDNGPEKIAIEMAAAMALVDDQTFPVPQQGDEDIDFAIHLTANGSAPLNSYRFVTVDPYVEEGNSVVGRGDFRMFYHPRSQASKRIYGNAASSAPEAGEIIGPQRTTICRFSENLNDLFKHNCSTTRGASGALLTYLDGALLKATGLHTGRDENDTSDRNGIALNLNYLVDSVCARSASRRMRLAANARLLHELRTAWNSTSPAREGSKAPSARDILFDSKGTLKKLPAPSCPREQGKPVLSVRNELPTATLGYSPPNNAVLLPAQGNDHQRESGYGKANFGIQGSSDAEMRKLASSIPESFRPPAIIGMKQIWRFVPTTVAEGYANPVRGQLLTGTSRLDVLRTKVSVLPSGVSLEAIQYPRAGSCEPKCERQAGYEFGVAGASPAFALESHSIGTGETLTSRDPRQMAHANVRVLIQNLRFEVGSSLVPDPCPSGNETNCGTLLRYNVIEDASAASPLSPIYRYRVTDYIETLSRSRDEAIVRLTRCKYLAHSETRWPQIQEMQLANCRPASIGQYVSATIIVQRYRAGKGVTCEIERSALEDAKVSLSRRYLVGHEHDRCLSQYLLELRNGEAQ